MYKIKNRETAITRFNGEYLFLSNFYEGKPFKYKGMFFTNSEAAFHSQKCLEREKEFEYLRPSQSKRLGRKVPLRSDWEEVKNDIMYDVCKAKFISDINLLFKLLLTGDSELIEGNFHHDNYWGMTCFDASGDWLKGENNLGQVLMKLRNNLKRDLGLEDEKLPESLKCPHKYGHYLPTVNKDFYKFLEDCQYCMHSDFCELTLYIEKLYDALHPEEQEKKSKIEESLKNFAMTPVTPTEILDKRKEMIEVLEDGEYMLGELSDTSEYFYSAYKINFKEGIEHFIDGCVSRSDEELVKKLRNINKFPVVLFRFESRVFTGEEIEKFLEEELAHVKILLTK